MPSQSAETKVVIVSVCVCLCAWTSLYRSKIANGYRALRKFSHTETQANTHNCTHVMYANKRERDGKTNIIEINSHKWHIDPDIVHRTRLAYFQR